MKPLDRKTKLWLDRNAIKVRDLSFDGSLSDLRPLKKVLKGVRVVQLGEQSHGDGASFQAKARLVRFLHRELGFDVLAFESGLYECEQANATLARGDGRKAMRDAVFGIWRVEETLPLFDYLADSATSKRPLRLSGFDVRGSGAAADRFLGDLIRFLEPVDAPSDQELAPLHELDAALNEAEYDPDDDLRREALGALAALRAAFDEGRGALVASHGERDVAFYSRCLDNYTDRERFEHSKTDPDAAATHASINLRDEKMAHNLRWLLEERYPGSKVICWAATFHQAHNLAEVSIRGDDDYYAGTRAMGEYLHDWYGDAVYTIAFAAHHGEGGIGQPRFTLSAPRPDSVEDLLHRYGRPYLLVNLRKPGPFDEVLHASPMSYDRTIKAPWSKVVDAFFFTDEMTPSTWPSR